jgi:hypothetical protein
MVSSYFRSLRPSLHVFVITRLHSMIGVSRQAVVYYDQGSNPILPKRQKIRVAIEGSSVAAAIMLFFALCGAWILHYLAISFTAFKLAGSIILLLVSLDMLSNRRQPRKEQGSNIAS